MAPLKLTLLIFAVIVVFTPALVSAGCSCEAEDKDNHRAEDEDNNRAEALKVKFLAIALILVFGLVGVCLPIFGRCIPALRPEKDVFFIVKEFAAGVILATGFVHLLTDASENLTSPCLKGAAWDFPWTGTIAMISAIVVLMIETQATSYFNGNQVSGDDVGPGEALTVHTHATHGHAHGTGANFSGLEAKLTTSELTRHRVIVQVLELGIVVHSVIIGISLGASESPNTIKPLFVALTFHQFFEGIGLGGCIAQAKLKNISGTIMRLLFSLTTPLGIVLGIAIINGYDENSKTALIVQGILNAISAGILIYVALVNLLAADFINPKMQSKGKLQIGSYAALLLGAGFMALTVDENKFLKRKSVQQTVIRF